MTIQDVVPELESNNCSVLAISSIMNKEIWAQTCPCQVGVAGVTFPLLEDRTGDIIEMYGVKRENSGYSFRAAYLVDETGLVQVRIVNDLPVGIGVKDLVRLVKACKMDKDSQEVALPTVCGVAPTIEEAWPCCELGQDAMDHCVPCEEDVNIAVDKNEVPEDKVETEVIEDPEAKVENEVIEIPEAKVENKHALCP